jgi:hypothetical protein
MFVLSLRRTGNFRSDDRKTDGSGKCKSKRVRCHEGALLRMAIERRTGNVSASDGTAKSATPLADTEFPKVDATQ